MRSIRSLSGRRGGQKVSVTVSRGRFMDEENFRLLIGGREAAHGKFFRGRKHYMPWIETVVTREREYVLTLLCRFLPNGSHIMVGYSEDRETNLGLKRGVPEAATPLGFILWNAGCRWFKDWYFAEGFKEGGVKLQGEKPLNGKQKRQLEKKTERELMTFMIHGGSGALFLRARERAGSILECI